MKQIYIKGEEGDTKPTLLPTLNLPNSGPSFIPWLSTLTSNLSSSTGPLLLKQDFNPLIQYWKDINNQNDWNPPKIAWPALALKKSQITKLRLTINSQYPSSFQNAHQYFKSSLACSIFIRGCNNMSNTWIPWLRNLYTRHLCKCH